MELRKKKWCWEIQKNSRKELGKKKWCFEIQKYSRKELEIKNGFRKEFEKLNSVSIYCTKIKKFLFYLNEQRNMINTFYDTFNFFLKNDGVKSKNSQFYRDIQHNLSHIKQCQLFFTKIKNKIVLEWS